MNYFVDPLTIDIGVTPIENMFFSTYLLMAPGDAVRLYLYAYKKAYQREEISHQELAEDLSMDIEEVHVLWDYWVETGIVEKIYDEKADYTIHFHSLRQLYLDNLAYSRPREAKDISYQGEPDALVKDSEETSVQKMFSEIEGVLGVVLRPNEIATVMDAMNDYHSSPELVSKAFSYSAEVLGVRDFHYALGVLRKWFMARVYTLEDLEEHLSKEKKKHSKKNERKNQFITPGQGQDRYDEDAMKALIRKKLEESRKGIEKP